MNTHIIETDFEPDDMIAILIHAYRYKGVNLIVIVGESESHNKIPIVKKFFEDLNASYSSITIYQGLSSEKSYPLEEQTEVTKDSNETILENYTYVYSLDPTISFMMKPPREAVRLKLKCPKTTIYCYGSFNWRTLKLDVTEFQELMSRYEKFYYIDSFTCIGNNNSGMFTGTKNKADNLIRDMIIKWNKHIIKDCENDLIMGNLDEESINRTKKIIHDVNIGIEKQFVMADVCLFLVPEPTEPVKLVELYPYPKWVPCIDSNIYIFSEGSWERRVQLLELLSSIQ
jgi:hypothetical protein